MVYQDYPLLLADQRNGVCSIVRSPNQSGYSNKVTESTIFRRVDHCCWHTAWNLICLRRRHFSCQRWNFVQTCRRALVWL